MSNVRPSTWRFALAQDEDRLYLAPNSSSRASDPGGSRGSSRGTHGAAIDGVFAMTVYKAPLRDYKFVLEELFDIGEIAKLPGYEEATPDTFAAVLEEAAKICEEVLFPLNHSGDAEGCTFENGVVRTPKGFKEAYELFREGGWTGARRRSRIWRPGPARRR